MTAPARPVLGVDGCRGGWVVVRLEQGANPSIDVDYLDELSDVVDQVRRGDVAAMAIDMPIGLFDDRPRPCDIEARRLLGSRRSTVFPAPVRATLESVDYADACRRSRAACGKALSKQAYNLLGAIRQLDLLLVPADADNIVEAHPELAFARLGDGPLPTKHGPDGRARRIELLDLALGPDFVELRRGADVPLTDLLDAAALTITADHLVNGTAIRLGGEPDSTGKPAQVLY